MMLALRARCVPAAVVPDEHNYRGECVAPLISPVFVQFAEQPRQSEIPSEVADLKVIANAVLQDGAAVNSEFLEGFPSYSCLMEFTTKRATIQVACDRVKLTTSSNEPIRLLVPRDTVPNDVCDTFPWP